MLSVLKLWTTCQSSALSVSQLTGSYFNWQEQSLGSSVLYLSSKRLWLKKSIIFVPVWAYPLTVSDSSTFSIKICCSLHRKGGTCTRPTPFPSHCSSQCTRNTQFYTVLWYRNTFEVSYNWGGPGLRTWNNFWGNHWSPPINIQ